MGGGLWGANCRRSTGLSPSRCSSNAHTSTARPGSRSRRSPTSAASFFVRRLLLRARPLGVPAPGPLGAVAELLEVVPAALRPDLAAEPGRHPRPDRGRYPG